MEIFSQKPNAGKKGQLSLINIIFFMILVAVAGVLTPIMQDFLSQSINDSNATGTTLLLMNSIIPFFWLGIIVTFFLYVTPIRPKEF